MSLFYELFYKSSIVTYDVQLINMTSTSGEVCAVFIFATNTIAVGIEIQIISKRRNTIHSNIY